MGLLGLDMGKVTLARKKSVGSAFFLKLVRPLVFRDPASAENRVMKMFDEIRVNQRHHPRQTKSAYLLDLSISSDLKCVFLSLRVGDSIALNSLFQFDIPT